MKIHSTLIASLLLVTSLSCTVYRSPQRKDFESESPQFRVQNLKITSCSSITQKPKASASRLVTVLQPETETETQYLWEHLINETSVFESDNLQGEYCVYQNQ